MLQEKNVNVLQKSLKLMQTYFELFPVRSLSLRELTQGLLNLYGGPQSPIDDMVVLLLLKCDKKEEEDLVLKGVLDSMKNCKDKNFQCILRTFTKYFKQKSSKTLLEDSLF